MRSVNQQAQDLANEQGKPSYLAAHRWKKNKPTIILKAKDEELPMFYDVVRTYWPIKNVAR